MEDTKIEVPKIFTGAIYETERLGFGVEQMVCLSRIELPNGKVQGLFRRFGLTFERFEEMGEEMAGWRLVWAPGQDKQEAPKRVGRPKKETKKIAQAK
jgi:hypothetical protein|tara:strand:- start:5261 stop:5554 length:294 start_codon:yes stop_codon:yes gene_type:complete